MATLRKKTFNWVSHSFRGSVHYPHGWEHDGVQADVGLDSPTTCKEQEVD